MIRFETKVVYPGMGTHGIGSFKRRLKRANVPFADLSATLGNRYQDTRYFVLWFNKEFEEDVFARTLDGKLLKVVSECARASGLDIHENTKR